MVVNLLPFRQGEFALDQIVLQINPRGHNRESLLLCPTRQLVNLLAMKEQPPVTEGIVVEAAPRGIRADVAINEPGFGLLDHRIAVFQVDLSFPDGLDFGSCQFHARLKPFQEVIEMLRLAIDGEILECGLSCLAHDFLSISAGI